MLPLMDMMLRAQDGEAVQAMARRFGLDLDQMKNAMAALMPAFAHGLQRSTGDPAGMATFMAGLATGRYMQYFDDAGRAFKPAGLADGQALVDFALGPPELTKALADQASAMSGVAETTIGDMMAPLAAMLMGGLEKQARGGLRTDQAEPNPFQEAMDNMLRQATEFHRAGRAEAETPAPPANPFLAGFADNPFMTMMQEMAGMTSGGTAPKTNPSGRRRNVYDDFFEEAFAAGARQRDDYRKTIEALFASHGTPRR